MSGALDHDLALMNAVVVPDVFPLQLAAYRALHAQHAGRLQSRSLHSELVFGLSGSKHIAETLQRFGIAESTVHLLVAALSEDGSAISAYLQRTVRGSPAPLEQLPGLADMKLLKKVGCLLDCQVCNKAFAGGADEHVACVYVFLSPCNPSIHPSVHALHQYYKLTAAEMEVGSIDDAIACRIASRDC